MRKLTKPQKEALGLREKEAGLLDVLMSEGEQNTSLLAYRAHIPRVTTIRLLSTLKERGLVSRREHPREVLWKSVDEETLREHIGTAFRLSPRVGLEPIELSEVGTLAIYRGEKEMHASNAKLLSMHTGERVLSIEPNGIWRHFAKMPPEDWHALNLLVKEKQIIFETILEEGFETVIKNEVGPEIESSFLSIPSDIRIVKDHVLDSSTEVLIFRDTVLFMDWEGQVAVEIKNPSTTRVMKTLFRLLQNSGKAYHV